MQFEGEEGDTIFEVGEARGEGFAGGGGFAKHEVDGDAGHFGDAGQAVGEAEGAETVVFFAGEAEADHVAAGFEGHRGGADEIL